jgi:hypothetical protein
MTLLEGRSGPSPRANDMDNEPIPPDTTTTEEPLGPAEQGLIQWLEECKGRKLTQQEINLALDQARAIGDL